MRFDAEWVRRHATPRLRGTSPFRLRYIFEPLWGIPPRPIRAARAELREVDLVQSMIQAARRLPERELAQVSRTPMVLDEVVDNFELRLPRNWVELMCWGHWIAMSVLPPEMPVLRNAYQALIEHEPQLHVAPYHPNRDHLVHQVADACLAVELDRRARPRGYDARDWDLLTECVPGLRSSHRREVTQAGLALAGLTHDIGYLRYIGATARERMATIFGVTVPAVSHDPGDLARVFAGTLLDRMLGPDPGASLSDGIIVDLYLAAWKRGDHGPLSAMVLASVARSLALEGRLIPVIDGILQVAIAAAFCHELHPVKASEADRNRPAVVREARRRLRPFRWPALFRIVDEMQCWYRPELRQRLDGDDEAVVMFGAQHVDLVDRELVITSELTRASEQRYKTRFDEFKERGSREAQSLRYLRSHLARTGASDLFDAIGIDRIRSVYPANDPI